MINPSNKNEYLWVYQKDKIKYFRLVRSIMSMKNFRKVLSKTVASVYTAYTYGAAIRGFIKRGVAL